MKEFRGNLLSHQKDNLIKLLPLRFAADWSECGTGKTVSILFKIVSLMNEGKLSHTLIVCPLSVMTTWGYEIEKYTDLSYTKLTGSLSDKIGKLDSGADVFIVSYDSLHGRESTEGKLLNSLISFGFGMLIADEASLLKHGNTYRTKTFTFLADRIPMKHFMSGTPITNSPMDVLSIYRALDGGRTFGKNLWKAKNFWFKDIGHRFPEYIMREERKPLFIERLRSISVRSLKEQCLDLPDKIMEPRYCYLTDEQKEVYVPIAEKLIRELEVDGKRIDITHALTRLNKLCQISAGFVYTDDGVHRFAKNPKLELLDEQLEKFKHERVIVYSRWKEDFKIINEYLQSSGRRYCSMDGDSSEQERNDCISTFRDSRSEDCVLVSNIGVGRYSFTLVEASVIAYYSITFSIEDWLQSQDRTHRIGQHNNCIYAILLGDGTVDCYIYSKLNAGLSLARSLVDSTELVAVLTEGVRS